MNLLRSAGPLLLAALLLSMLSLACGRSGNPVVEEPLALPLPLQSESGLPGSTPGLPTALPQDARQPWEQSAVLLTDPGRSALSAFEAATQFTPGVERFSEGGSVADLGEASQLQSGSAGSHANSFAMYRLPLGAAQPGALALDVNLHPRSDNTASTYYLGLSDYASGRWEWHGPYSEHHVRLARSPGRGPDVFAAAGYTSDFGNMFVSVVVSDGSRVDVLGLSLAQQDENDTTAPPQPTGLVATAVSGGLELQWNDVLAGDLAGFRIYSASTAFAAGSAAGVRPAAYVEGSRRHLLSGKAAQTFVRITALDASGNESAPSDMVSATPLAGSTPQLTLELAQPSVLRDEPLALSVQTDTPGLLLDYDLDGDGSFELTGQALGQQFVDTSSAGIIRPRVRAASPDAERVALGGVSLLVVANMRPVASALAAPQSGVAPLLVDFDGTVSTDFDGTVTGGGWDFDGDGLFDLFDETGTDELEGQFLFNAPGLYNAKLRVIDDQGAWDVDTVSIFVAAPGVNLPPQITQITASPALAAPFQNVDFNATAGDPDGSVEEYSWDFDNDGTDDAVGKTPAHAFGTVGVFNVRLSVTDDAGAADVDYVVVLVQGDPVDQAPVAILTSSDPLALIGKSTAPLNFSFDASESYDPEGGALTFSFDKEGDGSFAAYDGVSTVTHKFSTPGVYNPKLRVQDEAGNISQASLSVSVYQLSPHAIETGYTQANSTAIAALQSSSSRRLGVAYYDSGSDDLRFMRSADYLGNSWLPSYVVDAGGAEWMSLAQGATQFNLAYYQNGDLFFKASQNDGNSFNVTGTIDNTADDAGNYCCCAFVSGLPAVSYYNTTGGDLYFCRATNTGGSWGTRVVVDGTGVTGQYTSMAIVNGNPAIAYYREDNGGNLMYVRATNNTGSSWGSPLTVDASANDVGKFASLAVITGSDGARPAIAYLDATSNVVLYRRATDANGTNWGNAVTAAGNASAISLRQVSGHAMVVVSTLPTVGVSFNLSSDDVGAAWGSSSNIEGDSAGTLMSASVMPNGLPVLAYYDSSTNKELHVALPKLD